MGKKSLTKAIRISHKMFPKKKKEYLIKSIDKQKLAEIIYKEKINILHTFEVK